mmetsp:Transcript_50766/g.132045  ORF Transcript_50766/g.132045 Transcript_50766/m.132045 type:complete len:212 (+) Transcript_50766:891-1526(+)
MNMIPPRSGMPTLPELSPPQRPDSVRSRLLLPAPEGPTMASRAGPSSPPSLRSRFCTRRRWSGVRSMRLERRTSWSAVRTRVTWLFSPRLSIFRSSPAIRFVTAASVDMVMAELLMNEKVETTLPRLRPTCATMPTSSFIWKNSSASSTHGTMVPPAVNANEKQENIISHEIFCLRASIRSRKRVWISPSPVFSPPMSAIPSAFSRTWIRE